MRRDDEEAFVEFVTRFHALLLRHARLARVPVEDQEAVVVEVLGDMAERLTSQSVRIPRSMAGYLVTSLRNRLLNERRSEARRRQLGEAALSEIETHRERAMVDLCSEASLRASRGAAWEPFPTRPALARLAAALDRELSDDERRLVSWLGQHVTQRQIAAWLGISLAATAKRVLRLRTRLRDAADAYIAELDPAEQRELHDFFRRMARGEDR
jgi:RNA polymerase sigma factor (sigma-70 family)